MKAIIDEEARQMISYMADAAFRQDGINAYNKLQPFMNNLQMFPKTENPPEREKLEIEKTHKGGIDPLTQDKKRKED